MGKNSVGYMFALDIIFKVQYCVTFSGPDRADLVHTLTTAYHVQQKGEKDFSLGKFALMTRDLLSMSETSLP